MKPSDFNYDRKCSSCKELASQDIFIFASGSLRKIVFCGICYACQLKLGVPQNTSSADDVVSQEHAFVGNKALYENHVKYINQAWNNAIQRLNNREIDEEDEDW